MENGKTDPVKKRKRVNPLPHKFTGLDKKRYSLTAKQKHWCDIFLSAGANGVVASLETYKIANKNLCKIPWEMLKESQQQLRARAENTASHLGRENLRKLPIIKYLHKVLSDEGFTKEKVELQHFKNIVQDKNISASNTAIDMYYKKTGEYKPLEVKHGINERLEEFLDKQSKQIP